MPALQVMQLLAAPVVMISAGGLLCLALYNRLAMIVTRARLFHKEAFDARTRLESLSAQAVEAQRLRERLAVLDGQVQRILWRARKVRDALLALLTMVLCMLACSLALGATMLDPRATYVAFGGFALGVLAMGVAMVLAMVELVHALDPVHAERETLDPVGGPG